MKIYCVKSYGPLDPSRLSRLVEMVGHLPSDYEVFLKTENGGLIELKDKKKGHIIFYGLANNANSIFSNMEISPNDYGDTLLSVAEYVDLGKSKLYLNLNDGSMTNLLDVHSLSVYDFLEKYCKYVIFENHLEYFLDSNRIDEVDNFLSKDKSKNIHVKGIPLVEYAIILLNPELIRVLGKHGYDFTDSLHFLLEIGMADYQLISALIDCGASIYSKNSKGKTVLELESPWIEEIKKIASERGL